MKKIQNCSFADSIFLWKHYILIVPPKENDVGTAAILDFSRHVTSHKERLINWKSVSICTIYEIIHIHLLVYN